jgi:uncharacterized protein with FMN-binding domain
MKRVLLSIVATVVGVVALLSYKTHGPVASLGAGLPSAGVAGPSSTAAPSSTASSSTGAPPDPAASSAASVPTTSTPTLAAPASATYLGAAENTRYGIVQVKITVAGKKITNVAFVQLTAFDSRSQQINSDAAPTLLQETLSAQSAQIDSVSGASYTSQGYLQSLQSALDKAAI